MLKHVISKCDHLKFREKIMLKCTLGQMPYMVKKLENGFSLDILYYYLFIKLLVHAISN